MLLHNIIVWEQFTQDVAVCPNLRLKHENELKLFERAKIVLPSWSRWRMLKDVWFPSAAGEITLKQESACTFSRIQNLEFMINVKLKPQMNELFI